MFSIQYQTYFALKKIPEQRFNQAEIDCLTNLDHPNTINLYNCYKFDSYVYMLMEYCPNDLQTLLKDDIEIDEEVMRKYCHDILVAIKACHDHNQKSTQKSEQPLKNYCKCLILIKFLQQN